MASHSNLRGRQRDEVAEQVIERVMSGPATMRDLAIEFGYRPTLIRRLLEERGVRVEGAACVGFTEAELVRSLTMRYQASVSIDALADVTGLARHVVRGLLVKGGVTVPPQNSVPQELADSVIEQYGAGATLQELADQAGCSTTTVSRHLHAAGVQVRGRGSKPSSTKGKPTPEQSQHFEDNRGGVSGESDQSIERGGS